MTTLLIGFLISLYIMWSGVALSDITCNKAIAWSISTIIWRIVSFSGGIAITFAIILSLIFN